MQIRLCGYVCACFASVSREVLGTGIAAFTFEFRLQYNTTLMP